MQLSAILPVVALQLVGQSAAAPPPPAAMASIATLHAVRQALPPSPLTVDDAVRAGLQQSPQIAAAVAGAGIAAANYKALAAFPPLNLTVSYATGNTDAPSVANTLTDTWIDVVGALDVSGQRRYLAAAANAQSAAARYQVRESELTVAQQVRDAYWSLVAARAQAQIAQDNVETARRVNELTRLQEQAGTAPHVDVVRSGIDVATAQQSLLSAQGSERTALAALDTLLGLQPDEPLQLADSLTPPTQSAPVFPSPPALAQLSRIAIADRPLLQAARAQVRAAGYAVRQANAGRLPNVSVDYQRSVQYNDEAVILSASLPLLDFGSVRQSIRSAAASRRQAQAQERQQELQVQQAVAQAYINYQQALAIAATFPQEVITPSTDVLNMVQQGYKQGGSGILAVIDAESTLRTNRVNYINSLLSVYRAQDELLAAVGSITLATPSTRQTPPR